ncbi:triose-phosphate isomerase family protein [Nocardia terpenica]|uniref:Triosephosphate isomerase n=1 Tax=Nocardia terpenica TaxID=455432 RepID=A0A6G9Z1Z7_9NOCA|nr:triose-phosphate isomerase family protein [Nocardia terpenica]QIS19450.1 triosephosphate isomerase [Nocardia terpenica]
MSPTLPARPLVGVSLKMYFGIAQTRRWLRDLRTIADELRAADVIDLFVLPSTPAVADARNILHGSGIEYGAQNVSDHDRGPCTGETSPADLRELGCAFTMVGHAERRRLFGEDDAVTAAKAAALVRHAITPVVCIGERGRDGINAAVSACLRQIVPVIDAVPDNADLVFAYEPVWAIGAPEPAAAEYITAVAAGIRRALSERGGTVRILYGGSAGPGLYPALASAVDGLLFGRFVHDTGALRSALTEIVTGRRVIQSGKGSSR